MKLAKLLFGIFITVLIVGACTLKPAPGGPYEGKQFLFDMDRSIDNSFSTLDAFMSWELQNHAYLMTSSPSIFVAEEMIRTNAPLWRKAVGVARAQYIQLSTPDASNTFKASVTSLASQATLTKALKKP